MPLPRDPAAVWTAVVPAEEAVGLPARTLLHAGPPFVDPRRPSAPILSSAVLACRREGWARDEAEAEALIASGEVALWSAQHYGIVTPLAEVVSPATALVAVVDPEDASTRTWAPLGSGAGPQMRFGTRDAAVLERHAWRDGELARVLATVLAEPIDLLEPARAGLDAGDDLHASTAGATAALATRLDALLPRDAAGERVRVMLRTSPLFFLTLWMAACRTLLLSFADALPTLVVALAGNGRETGVLLARDLQAWATVAASPPEGARIDPASTHEVSPMIGDSGVIDVAGFGGQCQATTPVRAFLELPHRRLGMALGLDARLVVAGKAPPVVHIGMIAADGRAGLLGRGVYRPPLSLFRAAITDRMARTMPT